ncbi:SRP54-type protein, GTPase domain [Carpediemonas membranifera]|uniref:SRP54-type protein, GTPase domain n=1 Tax=Carpediemonas membranifera TaxID=201153 RepID=A0A8J6AQZ6_9EUKA|nr:SRP54-type protein, GTPase domain [Carpediemonas membranifera]|eukprot:KAG9391648.1 SRP54-type protein, GTPase domain [Carpediemonas membranifera]
MELFTVATTGGVVLYHHADDSAKANSLMCLVNELIAFHLVGRGSLADFKKGQPEASQFAFKCLRDNVRGIFFVLIVQRILASKMHGDDILAALADGFLAAFPAKITDNPTKLLDFDAEYSRIVARSLRGGGSANSANTKAAGPTGSAASSPSSNEEADRTLDIDELTSLMARVSPKQARGPSAYIPRGKGKDKDGKKGKDGKEGRKWAGQVTQEEKDEIAALTEHKQTEKKAEGPYKRTKSRVIESDHVNLDEIESTSRILSMFRRGDADVSSALKALRSRLIERNVAVDVADSICDRVRQDMQGGRTGMRVSRAVTEAVSTTMAGILSTHGTIDVLAEAEQHKRERRNGRPYVIAFVGVNGVGKCLGKDTPVLMADGEFKPVQDVVVGDILMGDDGTPRTVGSVTTGRQEMARVSLQGGAKFTCNMAHILTVALPEPQRLAEVEGKGWAAAAYRLSLGLDGGATAIQLESQQFDTRAVAEGWLASLAGNPLYVPADGVFDISVESFFALPDAIRAELKAVIAPELSFHGRADPAVPVHPYVVGAWLGAAWDDAMPEDTPAAVLEAIEELLPNRDPVEAMRPYGKRVPPAIKYGPAEARRQCLAGLVDTNGYQSGSRGLVDDAAFMARSLGLFVTKSGEITGDLARLPLRVESSRPQPDQHRQAFTVERLPEDDYYGFTIDGNARFIINREMVVTHNSTSLAKVAALCTDAGLTVSMAACDTFRSGAIEQLKLHATRLGVDLIESGYSTTPANVAKFAINETTGQGRDVLLIDTAGRMQGNSNLMRQLTNLVDTARPDRVLFVGEALVGGEAVSQLTAFNEALASYSDRPTPHLIDGIVLTKYDAVETKVGAAITMVHTTNVPIAYVGNGQRYEDLVTLRVSDVVKTLLL